MFYVLIFACVFLLLFTRILEEDEDPGTEELHVYFYKLDRDFEGWDLWVWEKESSLEGKAYTPNKVESERVQFVVPLEKFISGSPLGLLFRKDNWEKKEGGDRFWNPSESRRIYAVEGEKEFYLKQPKLRPCPRAAFLDSKRHIQVLLPCKAEQNSFTSRSVKVSSDKGKVLPIEGFEVRQDGWEIEITLKNPLDLRAKRLDEYKVKIKGFRVAMLQPRGILYDAEIFYEAELGMSLEGSNLVFRTFAPMASLVEVLLYKELLGGEQEKLKMIESRPGLWEASASFEAWKGGFYKYRVHGHGIDNRFVSECLDPYSRCHTGRYGRSHIQFDQTPVREGPRFSREEIVIYEAHLRDFSIFENSGIKNKGKYLSLTEKETHLKRAPAIKTGLAHLKELGVNTIQLLPLQNFDVDDESEIYDWGYMPCHFFAPHGAYATDPANLSRVVELKKAISTLHEEGFKIILDVVFNHTAEGTEEVMSFQALAPHYYYRRDHEGKYFNGSGCGNEFKTEAPMARKFILDCLKFWVNEYKIDGFRFDLMGLLDLETFRRIETDLVQIKPDIILYGEPWAAAGAGVEVLGKGVQRGTRFSVFNDLYRDALRGDNSKWGKGFAQGAGAKGEVGIIIPIKEGILGSINEFASEPVESINYVACHDNYTLKDKLVLSTGDNESIDEDCIEKMEWILAVLLMTSQGIPFIHSGQEFGRSKDFHENSYNAPDEINQLDWSLKKKNKSLFRLYKDLISLRKQHRILRLPTADQVRKSVEFLDEGAGHYLPPHCLAFQVRNPGIVDSFNSILVAVNAGPEPAKLALPKGDWKTVMEAGKTHLKVSTMKSFKSQQLELTPWDSRILARINQAV
jgi:pullulanase